MPWKQQSRKSYCGWLYFWDINFRGLNKNNTFAGFKICGHSISFNNLYRKLKFRGYWNSWIRPSMKTTKIGTPRNLSYQQYLKQRLQSRSQGHQPWNDIIGVTVIMVAKVKRINIISCRMYRHDKTSTSIYPYTFIERWYNNAFTLLSLLRSCRALVPISLIVFSCRTTVAGKPSWSKLEALVAASFSNCE